MLRYFLNLRHDTRASKDCPPRPTAYIVVSTQKPKTLWRTMSQTTSIALAWSNDSFPPPDVIWKKAVDDQTLYFSGWSLKMRSEGQALPSSPNLGNAQIKIKPAMRAKTNITPVYQPSPRNHCVDLMSRFRSWNAPLNQVIARLNILILWAMATTLTTSSQSDGCVLCGNQVGAVAAHCYTSVWGSGTLAM